MRRVRRASAAGVVLAALVAAPVIGPVTGAARADTPPGAAHADAPTGGVRADTPAAARVDRTLRDPRITESSGLVASAVHPGVLWTHDDSGNPPLLFAVGRDGTTVATVRVRGVLDSDWEALAGYRDARGRSMLAIGDLGDNAASRASVQVALLPEPALRDATVRAERLLTLTYPDGAHDAEALLVDPSGRRMLVVTKGLGGTVYEVPPSVFPGGGSSGTMRRLAGVPLVLVTDGVLTASGHLLLRTYGELAVLPPVTEDVVGGTLQPLTVLPLPHQKQGEGLALPDPRHVLLSSEGAGQPVWSVPLPAEVTALLGPAPAAPVPPAATSPASAPVAGEPASEHGFPPAALAVLGALVLAAAAAVATRVRRR